MSNSLKYNVWCQLYTGTSTQIQLYWATFVMCLGSVWEVFLFVRGVPDFRPLGWSFQHLTCSSFQQQSAVGFLNQHCLPLSTSLSSYCCGNSDSLWSSSCSSVPGLTLPYCSQFYQINLLPCDSSALVLFGSTTSVSLQTMGFTLTTLLALPSWLPWLAWIFLPLDLLETIPSPLTCPPAMNLPDCQFAWAELSNTWQYSSVNFCFPCEFLVCSNYVYLYINPWTHPYFLICSPESGSEVWSESERKCWRGLWNWRVCVFWTRFPSIPGSLKISVPCTVNSFTWCDC